MRIQYVSRLTKEAAAALRPVAPILVVAGGSHPTGNWDHIITVSPSEGRAVDAGGFRFLTMPFEKDPIERHAEFKWLMRELEIARTDLMPVVCVSRGAPGFILAAGTSIEAVVLPHVRKLLRDPIRAWIAGNTPVAMNVSWGKGEGLAHLVKGGSNPFGARGYCGEIFMDVSTEAVREVPVLAQLMGGGGYGMYRIR